MFINQSITLMRSIFRAFRDEKVTYRFATAFHGPAGVGKTQGAVQAATEEGMAIVNVRVGQLEPGDLIGIPYKEVLPSGITVMKYSIPNYLPQYMYRKDDDGKVKPILRSDGSHAIDIEALGDMVVNKDALLEMYNGDLKEVRGVVLFLDEINRVAGDDTKQAIFQLPEMYGMHTYRLPKRCCIIAAANPATNDYQTNDIDSDKAFMDRFLHIKIRPRIEDWLVWADKKKINPTLQQFYNSVPGSLFTDEGPITLKVDPSPRSGQLMHTLLEEVELPNDDTIRAEVYMGVLGDKYGPIFNRHLKENVGKIPSGEEIMVKYEKPTREIVEKALKNNSVDVLDQITRNIHQFSSNEENWAAIEEKLPVFELYIEDLVKYSREKAMALVKQLIDIKVESGRGLVEILGTSDKIYDLLQAVSAEADSQL